MAIQHAVVNFNTVNVSAQVGDMVYYTLPGGSGGQPLIQGGFEVANLSGTFLFGEIFSIINSEIIIQYDDSIVSLPPANSFLSFAKNKKVNTSSLIGYYAEVKFVNDSTDKIEMFGVGSEVVESSK